VAAGTSPPDRIGETREGEARLGVGHFDLVRVPSPRLGRPVPSTGTTPRAGYSRREGGRSRFHVPEHGGSWLEKARASEIVPPAPRVSGNDRDRGCFGPESSRPRRRARSPHTCRRPEPCGQPRAARVAPPCRDGDGGPVRIRRRGTRKGACHRYGGVVSTSKAGSAATEPPRNTRDPSRKQVTGCRKPAAWD
jgi:hypothetical protein